MKTKKHFKSFILITMILLAGCSGDSAWKDEDMIYTDKDRPITWSPLRRKIKIARIWMEEYPFYQKWKSGCSIYDMTDFEKNIIERYIHHFYYSKVFEPQRRISCHADTLVYHSIWPCAPHIIFELNSKGEMQSGLPCYRFSYGEIKKKAPWFEIEQRNESTLIVRIDHNPNEKQRGIRIYNSIPKKDGGNFITSDYIILQSGCSCNEP